MKRPLVFGWLLAGSLAFAATAIADDGHGKHKGQPHPNKAKGTIQTIDNGCSGAPWALDTIQRKLKVHRNSDGSYRVKLEDKGTFTTTAGVSPGNCPENTSKHGTSVLANVHGSFHGYIKGTVTGGTFDPKASCTANPCTKAAFIAAFFGPAAQFSCLSASSSDCRFDYKYRSKDEGLLYRKWRDRGRGAGSQLKEQFRGDIANA